MRILLFTSRLPFPPYRGDKLKIWNLLRQVSRVHDVALVSFIQHESERALAAELRPFCKRIELVHFPAWRSVLECARAIPGTEPFQVAYFRSSEMRRLLQQVASEWKPDLIHTHLIRLASYTEAWNGVPKVLDMTDAVSVYLRKFLESERNPAKHLFLKLEYGRMLGYERVIARYDRALVCSTVDRDALLENVPDSSIDILYNGVDTETFTRRPDDQAEPGRIIFTGNMSYLPNADGAGFMAGSIFPLIKRRVPGAKLYIVGQRPPAAVRALSRDDVVVTGFVKDLRVEYARSAVAVSPIRFGAGTLNKILEPLAMGVPVVATSHGVSGLELRPGEEILVADAPEKFADHVVRLLTDESLRGQIASAATDRIRARFNWETIGRSLLQTYNDVVAESRRVPAPAQE